MEAEQMLEVIGGQLSGVALDFLAHRPDVAEMLLTASDNPRMCVQLAEQAASAPIVVGTVADRGLLPNAILRGGHLGSVASELLGLTVIRGGTIGDALGDQAGTSADTAISAAAAAHTALLNCNAEAGKAKSAATKDEAVQHATNALGFAQQAQSAAGSAGSAANDAQAALAASTDATAGQSVKVGAAIAAATQANADANQALAVADGAATAADAKPAAVTPGPSPAPAPTPNTPPAPPPATKSDNTWLWAGLGALAGLAVLVFATQPSEEERQRRGHTHQRLQHAA